MRNGACLLVAQRQRVGMIGIDRSSRFVAETGCRRTTRRWFTIIVVTCARNKPQSPPPRRTCVPPPLPSRNGCILTGSACARAIDIFTLPRQERAPAIWPTDPQAAAGRRERGHEARALKTEPVRSVRHESAATWVHSTIADDCADCYFLYTRLLLNHP